MRLFEVSPGRNSLILISLVSVTLFVAFSGILYYQYSEASRVNRWAMQQYEVLRGLRVVLTDLLNAETGMRGYLLTGQTKFLEPYNDAVTILQPDLETLRQQTAGDSTQHKNVTDLIQEANDFRVLLETDAALLRTSGKSAITEDTITTQKDHMDHLRLRIEDIVKSGLSNLNLRLDEAQQSSQQFIYTLILGTLFSIGVLLFSLTAITSLAARNRRADDTIRENEQRFMTVMNGINDGLFDYDMVKGSIYYSPSYRAMLGYSEAEYPNTLEAFQERMHPDDAASAAEAARRYRERETPNYTNVFRMRHKNGTWRWVLSRGIGIWDRDGRLTRLIGTHTDITEQKQREEDLKQLNTELESFTYIASHDLRSPLVNLKGFAGEMEYSLQQSKPIIERLQVAATPEERKILNDALERDIPEALGFIKKSVEKMDLLISAVLDLSRVGRREYQFVSVDTMHLIKRCLDTMAYEINQGKINVTCKDLPKIISDPIVIEQVFSNILDNAVKFLRPGEPGQITIGAELGKDDITFSIADNGRGIAVDDAGKIFQIFRRARNTADVRGLGMGMAFVKASLRKLGGSIWFDSTVNQGTTFYVKLPVRPVV